jgi:FtsZ-binding cell division protein ZapB
MNQRYYDPEMLKQQLNSCKAIMHEQKSTFLNLKIRYSKLYNENLNNKNLISNILGVPLDKYLTKDEVLDKIENVKLNKKKRAQLEEAFECILLKMEIEDKKEKNAKLARYSKELKENSKIKKIIIRNRHNSHRSRVWPINFSRNAIFRRNFPKKFC